MDVTKQIPSQGRIVIYHHAGSKDGKYPPMTSPAIVINVKEPLHAEGVEQTYELDLFVMTTSLNSSGTFFPRDVKHINDTAPGSTCWSWPPRV